MLRPLAITLLAASFVTRIAIAPARADDALALAQAQIDRGQACEAVDALESQLIQADDSTRPAILELLRRAYAAAATESERAGQNEQAEVYRTNLAILNERLGPETDSKGDPEPEPEPKGEPLSSPPPALPDPEDTQRAAPVQAPATEGVSPQATAESPKVGMASLANTPPSTEPEPKAGPTEPDRAALLKQADDLYRAENYSQAGAIYTRMAAANQLPENRRNVWAYCRRFEVVKRINGQPRSDGEWAAIAAEITAIRQLSPSVWWFDVYLQDLVRERSGQVAKVSPKSNQVVLRGAQPEERPLTLPRRSPRPKPKTPATSAGEPSGSAEAPSEPPRTALPVSAPSPPAPNTESPAPLPLNSTETLTDAPVETPSKPAETTPFHDPDLSRWQVENTANFRIYHADPTLAKRVARIAETTREEQIRRWTGQPPRATWYPLCEIYLYPNAKVFAERTDQPEDSPGFSTSGLMAGRVTARRINLRADHDKLEQAILPHEVTHIVLAEMFADQQIPRWADEGMAVLAEPTDEQHVRAQDLSKPLNGGRIFGVEQLLVMDYPDGQFWPLYYAQSISLTRFLVETSTPVRFIQFVKDAQRHGYDAALRRHYQINGLTDLQSKWESYARSTIEVRTASNEPDSPERE